MQPTPHPSAALPPPTGAWLTRGVRALVVERRLPYRVSVWLDEFCNRAGLRKKTLEANGIKVRIRRLTCDALFVQSIIVNEEYTASGFDISSTDTVIDIGGNIGTFTLLAARCASRGHVFSFEPNGENYALLSQNIALNNCQNVTARRVAVAGRTGRVTLLCAAQGGFHGISPEQGRKYVSSETVNAVTLQDIFDEHDIAHCDLLKVDCEGAEYEIFSNLPNEYFERIERIVMEYHGRSQQAVDDLLERLQRLGFGVETYTKVGQFVNGLIRVRKRAAPARA